MINIKKVKTALEEIQNSRAYTKIETDSITDLKNEPADRQLAEIWSIAYAETENFENGDGIISKLDYRFLKKWVAKYAQLNSQIEKKYKL